VKRIPRRSEIRVTGLDGETRIGQGDGLAAAVRTLTQQYAPLGEQIEAERRAAVQRAKEEVRGEERWGLTPAGALALAADRTTAYLDDPTLAAAVAMEDAYSLAERLAQLDEWGG
jgi:hypothetical protein